MTLLSRKADYALLILSYLHQTGRRDRPGRGGAVRPEPAVRREHPEGTLPARIRRQPSRREGRLRPRPAREHRSRLAELLETIEDGFRLTMCNPGDDHDHETCSHRRRLHVEGADGGGPPAGCIEVLRGRHARRSCSTRRGEADAAGLALAPCRCSAGASPAGRLKPARVA